MDTRNAGFPAAGSCATGRVGICTGRRVGSPGRGPNRLRSAIASRSGRATSSSACDDNIRASAASGVSTLCRTGSGESITKGRANGGAAADSPSPASEPAAARAGAAASAAATGARWTTSAASGSTSPGRRPAAASGADEGPAIGLEAAACCNAPDRGGDTLGPARPDFARGIGVRCTGDGVAAAARDGEAAPATSPLTGLKSWARGSCPSGAAPTGDESVKRSALGTTGAAPDSGLR